MSAADAVKAAMSASEDDQEIERLARLRPIEYDRERAAAAKRLGIGVTALNEEVVSARKKAAGTGKTKGRLVQAKVIEPWPEPVILADVLDELAAAINRYVVVPPEAITAITLWTVHTHVFDRYKHTPRLFLYSPEKRCGKSTLLEILGHVCRDPRKTDNITSAAAFRLVEEFRPTLLLDEMDSYARDNNDHPLKNVLNTGFERTGNSIRCEKNGDKQELVAFSTFAPCAVACIKYLPTTIADRAIPIPMVRKLVEQSVERLNRAAEAELDIIGRKLVRWAADAADDLAEEVPTPSSFNDRQVNFTQVLLAIADAASPTWSSRARDHLEVLFAADDDGGEGGLTNLLLFHIREVFNNIDLEKLAPTRYGPFLQTDNVLTELLRREDGPWKEMPRSHRPITSHDLAFMLKGYKVKPKQARALNAQGISTSMRGYYQRDLEPVFDRYLPPLPGRDGTPFPHSGGGKSATPLQSASEAGFSRKPSATEPLQDPLQEPSGPLQAPARGRMNGARWQPSPDITAARERRALDAERRGTNPQRHH
jgi:hypothetical protein